MTTGPVETPEDDLRGTGRTTRGILRQVNWCIEKAGEPVKIADHYDSPCSHHRVADSVCDILHILNIPFQRMGRVVIVTPMPARK